MKLTTRDRIIEAAASLFADHGYRGASVRDICNLAGTNPGAVSYHFGGKRQLYRAVLRRAGERLAGAAALPADEDGKAGDATALILGSCSRVQNAGRQDPVSVRLVLRDLADGGGAAVEALTPSMRSAANWLAAVLGHDESRSGSAAARLALLELAAPLFLLSGAWPVVERSFDLDAGERDRLLHEMITRVVARFFGDGGSPHAR